jgi:hypothetical protein
MRSYVNVQYYRKRERQLPIPLDPFHTYSTYAFVQIQLKLRDIHYEATHLVIKGDQVVPYKDRET